MYNDSLYFRHCGVDFIQNVSYEYISEPAIIADLGNMTFLFSNFCIVAQVNIINGTTFDLDINQTFISLENLTLSIDGVADVP
jgi:hypothetical protein